MNRISLATLLILSLAGCSSAPTFHTSRSAAPIASAQKDHAPSRSFDTEPAPSQAAKDVTMYALMLIDTGYTFGGKNQSAGLDCSGLIHVVFKEAVNISITGNAATMATKGKQVDRNKLRAGDLVFFNTMNRPFSHVGIYIGNSQFVHAPNSRGRVRVEKLTTGYWSTRFEMARTLLG